MDEAPALIDGRMIEQPFNRPPARPGDAFLDFFDLFGGVDMNRPGFGQWHDCRQFVWRHGPQAVRSDTDIGTGQRADGHPCGGNQLGELVDRADEPALAGMWCGATKRAVRVETRQQCEPDAGDLGGSRNSRRHLRRIGIGPAVVVVMEIVEFPDARIPLLEHLDIEQRCDGFRVFGSHLQREAIHRLAPGPERIRSVAARFGEPCHATLECVTMQARYSRDCELVAFIVGSRRCAGRNLGDGPIAHNHLHVIGPPSGKQCRCEMQSEHVSKPGGQNTNTIIGIDI